MGILFVAHMHKTLIVFSNPVFQLIFSNDIFRHIAVLCRNQCVCDQITEIMGRGCKIQPAPGGNQQQCKEHKDSGESAQKAFFLAFTDRFFLLSYV
ncbi:hypothetical protein D3C71_2024760 [compost metagenome]